MMGDRWSPASRDDADSPPPPLVGESRGLRKKRKMVVYEDEEEEEWNQVSRLSSPRNSDMEEDEDEDDDEEVGEDAMPIGEVVRVSGEGESIRNHFKGFEVDGASYMLEDTVLVCPGEHSMMTMKPSVALIKDIATTEDGSVTVTGQMFYRPEVAEKENGGNWESEETRELFYSFDMSEFPAVRVMHKCLVHFIPPNKMIPSPQEHPGFIVRNVYDAKSKKLFEGLGAGYEDRKKYELDVLVQKTITQIPNLQEQIIPRAKKAVSSKKTL